MGAGWFYSNSGGQSGGPLTIEELRTAISRQPAPVKVKVWRSGLPDWKEAHEVEELKSRPSISPLQPTDASANTTVASIAGTPRPPTIEPWKVDAPRGLRAKKSAYRELFSNENHERVLVDLNTFFGPRGEPYIRLFEEMRLKESLTVRWSWSWPTFFLSFVWFFYRKMYLVGAFVILVPVVTTLLFPGAGQASAYVVFTVLAKPTYVQSAVRRIAKADALGLAGAERADYLTRAGGVSWTAGVLAGALYALFVAAAIYGFINRPTAS